MNWFSERLVCDEARLEELQKRAKELEHQEAQANLEFDRELLEMVSNLRKGGEKTDET